MSLNKRSRACLDVLIMTANHNFNLRLSQQPHHVRSKSRENPHLFTFNSNCEIQLHFCRWCIALIWLNLAIITRQDKCEIETSSGEKSDKKLHQQKHKTNINVTWNEKENKTVTADLPEVAVIKHSTHKQSPRAWCHHCKQYKTSDQLLLTTRYRRKIQSCHDIENRVRKKKNK